MQPTLPRHRRRGLALAVLVATTGLAAASPPSRTAATGHAVAADTAYLAGGCYWGTEAVYEHVRGVLAVVSGFATPSPRAPSAEAVRIVYDPARITYDQLLDVFFTAAHDPTQVDRQGPDVGAEYRSLVFPRTAEQRRAAETAITRLTTRHTFRAPIATRLADLSAFTEAPAVHQDFVAHNPTDRYVVAVDLPKLAHLKATFPALYRD